MKRTVLLLCAILAASNLLFAIERNDSPSDKPRLIITEDKSPTTPQLLDVPGKNIIIFDNLDKDFPVSNYFELAYTDAIKGYPTADPYLDHTVRVTFSDQTFANYNITDFDVAIFPMGEYPLNTITEGGVKVMDKIKEMLNANKNVLIIGRRILNNGLHNPGLQDPSVTEFLTSELGLRTDSSGGYNFLMGSTFIPFRVIGDAIDVFFRGYTMYCNLGYGRGGADPDLPIRSEGNVEIMRFKKNNTESIGIDYIDQIGEVGDDSPKLPKYLCVGLRADSVYNTGGRVVMWTIAPNVAALNEMPIFGYKIQAALNWLLDKMPKLKPWLQLETTTLTFPLTPLKYSVTKSFKVQNFSKEKLKIDSTRILFPEDTTFTLIKGISNSVLEPMEVRTIEVKFYPVDEMEYNSILNVYSNAYNGQELSVQLQGRGGANVSPEPEISIQEVPYDYGTIDVGEKPTKDVKFSNTGLQDLIVDSIYFETSTDGSFLFAQTVHTPIVVKNAEEVIFSVRFVPTEWGKNFIGKIKIVSNSKHNPVAYINLVGKTPGAPEGPMIEALIDTTDFQNVKIGASSRYYVGITNPGSQTLRVNNIYIDIDKNPDDAFVIDTTMDFPIFIEPNNSFNFPVKFTPLTDHSEYIVPVGIFSNSVTFPVFYLYLRGYGDTTVSVREIVSNSSQTLILRATPIPITYSSNITVDAQKFFGSSSIDLYDLLGNKLFNIFNGNLAIGTNHFTFDATNIPSGQYFIILSAGSERLSLPLMIIK